MSTGGTGMSSVADSRHEATVVLDEHSLDTELASNEAAL